MRVVLAAVLAVFVVGAHAQYDAGFLENGKVQICGYSGSCTWSDTPSDHGTTTPPLNTGVGWVKITNDSAPHGITINVGHAAPGASGIPDGWTPGVGGAYPTPPATDGAPGVPTYSASFGGGTCTVAASVQACFDQMVPGFNQALCGGAAPVYAYTYTAPTMSVTRSYPGTSTPGSCSSGGYSSGAVTVGATCAPGYVNVSGTCTLDNPDLVPYPDEKCEIVRVGNTFTFDSRAKGCGTTQDGPGKATGLDVSGGTVTAAGPGTTVQVTASGSGTGTITVSRPNPSGTGTVTTTIEVGPGGAGPVDANVTGTGVTTVGGTGTLTGTGTAPAAEPTCGSGALPPCNVKVDETGTPTGTSQVSTGAAALEAAKVDAQAKIAALGAADKVTSVGWSWGGFTLPSVSCSPWAFSFKSWTVNVQWCSWFGVVRSLWGWALSILAALFVWRTFTESMAHGGY